MFNSGARTDFEACYSLVMSPNISQSYPEWFSFTDSSRPWLLTLLGCEKACGKGAQLWSAQDTLFRFALWIMPAIVLIGHFHFPPLSKWNNVAIMIRLFGDPIDCLWSMLTRYEVNRRFYRWAVQLSKSLKIDEKHRQPLIEAIAGIWTSYDELGWGGASLDILKTFERREVNVSPREVFYVLRASHLLTSNRSSSEFGTWIAILGMLGALFTAYIRTWMQKLENQTSHTIAIVSMLFTYMPIVKISGDIGAFSSPSDAVDIILELQQDLRTCSMQSGILELFPALEFYPEMPWRKEIQGNRNRDRQDREQTTPEPQRQTQHPFVEAGQPAPPPELLHTSRQSEEDVGIAVVPSYDLITSWVKIAPSLGMNIVFRPPKAISVTSKHHEDRHHYLLAYSMAFVIIGSYAPAFLLSYFTFWTVGFGCRCLAWSLILSFWLLSLLADAIFKYRISSARYLWYITVAKDIPVAAFFIGTIIWLQVGWVNNCWCRSKVIWLGEKAVVDLAPLSEGQRKRLWMLWPLAPLLGLIFTGGLYWWVRRAAGMMLCRDPKERHKNLLVIARLKEDLEGR